MKISKRFMKRISGFFGMLLLLAPLTVLAQTKVVVIPLGDDAKPLKNIITVAKANGNFTDPVAAVNSIVDAFASNPYLVVIGPGVYTINQPLVMKPYVDIVGSGENVTKLTGAISTGGAESSAIISGASYCALSSLALENTGGGYHSIALHNNNASLSVMNLTAKASGGTSNNFGIYNYNSSPKMTNVTVTASGGTTSNHGVYDISSTLTMTNVTVTVSGGTASYGVYNDNSSYSTIRRSTMKGGNYSLYTQGGTTTVSQSTLTDGAAGVGTKTCIACDDGSGAEVPANCQ